MMFLFRNKGRPARLTYIGYSPASSGAPQRLGDGDPEEEISVTHSASTRVLHSLDNRHESKRLRGRMSSELSAPVMLPTADGDSTARTSAALMLAGAAATATNSVSKEATCLAPAFAASASWHSSNIPATRSISTFAPWYM